jgi:DNA-binding response OmpR family regulator
MSTLLVVEDEPSLSRLVRDYLERAGFQVLTSATAGDALRHIDAQPPALIVLDLGLPDRDGFDVIRDVRRTLQTPIIVLTARGDEADRIVGLELGADDYVIKPFSPRELVARVRAVLRRTEQHPEPVDLIEAAELTIDLPRMRVLRDGEAIELTPSEFQILVTLAREPGRVFTRAHLLDAIHGVMIESYERAIDAHVKNLRRKLEPVPARPRFVQTVHGVGYRFNDAI